MIGMDGYMCETPSVTAGLLPSVLAQVLIQTSKRPQYVTGELEQLPLYVQSHCGDKTQMSKFRIKV